MKITARGGNLSLFSTRRPTVSSRYRAQRKTKTQQRRYKSSSAPENETGSSSSSEATAQSHGASSKTEAAASTSGSVASSAGASSAPLATQSARRTFGQMVRSSALGRLGDAYSRAQNKRPYVTQLCSSLVVYLIGDLSAQLMFPSDDKKGAAEESKSDAGEGEEEQKTVGGSGVGYDPLRTLRHLTVGAISSIPSYKWFMFLHHNFNYASKFLSITTKVAVQQACFTPVFNTYFFSMQSLLAGASLEETWERLKKAVPTSIKNSVKLWPAVTAFSFMYIPPHFRSVFGGTIAVGWQTYLSWLNQKAAREVEAAEAAEGARVQTGLASAEVSSSQAALRT